MNSPIASSLALKSRQAGRNGVNFENVAEALQQKANDAKGSSQLLFLIQENYQMKDSDFGSPDEDHLIRSQSPVYLEEQRGRTLQSAKTLNARKKGVLVIKKESINRQNSQSRSPVNELDNSLGSPYHSPKASEVARYVSKAAGHEFNINNEKLQEQNSQISKQQTSVKNSVIIRKTVGELKRQQLNVFYFDSNFTKSCGPLQYDCQRKLSEQEKVSEPVGRNSNQVKYHPFIQRTEFRENQKILDQAFQDSLPRKSLPIPSETYLLNKFDQNKAKREALLNEKLDQSSESDDLFERQSSNTMSVETLSTQQRSKKLVISKRDVNFTQSESQDHSKSLGNLQKMRKNLDNAKSRLSAKLELDQILDLQLMFGQQSKSPECLRRQRSDNIIGVRTNKKELLSHERSQNQLALHLYHKFEVPKVVKAIPNALNQEILKSPTTNSAIAKEQMMNAMASISNIQSDQSKQLMNKSRQTNIFQMRRSQTSTKDQVDSLKQGVTASASPSKKSPLKKVEARSKKQGEISRVSQSLLLDNYYSRSKERSENRDKGSASLQQDNFSAKSGDLINQSTGPSSKKVSPDVYTTRNLSKDSQRALDPDNITVPTFLNYGRRSTLSQHLNKLIDDNRCNSPVRVNQYLVDIDYLKAKAQERIASQVHSSQATDSSLHTMQRDKNQPPYSATSSNNAILSLSQANTTEKFKEIIDNLFVPTASAFKKKSKEKEFRRPTQNPPRRSKSQQRQSAHGQMRQRVIKPDEDDIKL